KMIDDFEHAHPAVAGDEGLELFRRLVELLGRHPIREFNLDSGKVVHLLVRQHASRLWSTLMVEAVISAQPALPSPSHPIASKGRPPSNGFSTTAVTPAAVACSRTRCVRWLTISTVGSPKRVNVQVPPLRQRAVKTS